MTLHLNAFLMGVGNHEAAWRLPESDPFAHVDVKLYQNLARIAERGKLDSLFLADGPVLWNDLGRRERLTVRELIGRLGGGRGHLTFAGTPEQVADEIAEWYQAGAADGFNIMPPVLPSGLTAFVDHVVPILQRRGLFRTEYEGKTLRDNYGLPRPANRNVVPVLSGPGR